MSRTLSTSVSTAISGSVVRPFFAIEIDFDSGQLCVWNGLGDKVILGKSYLGSGQLISISSIQETAEMEAKGATLTMSGIPASFLSLALTEPYQGRECRIYFGVMEDPDARVEIFSGFLDQMNISENFDSATISITVENELIRLERPVIRRFTNEDQKSRYPTDLGLEFVAGLQDKEIFWGRVAK